MKSTLWSTALIWLAIAIPLRAQVFEANSEQKVNGAIGWGDLNAVIHVQKTTPESQGYTGWTPTVRVFLKHHLVGTIQGAEAPFPGALVQIVELDTANPYPEVLLSSFTGGAHCCNQVTVLTSDASGHSWQKVELGAFNGSPQPAEDIDFDNRDEYVTADDRFLYTFASYAGSAAPAQIWQLQGNQFVDVTHQPQFIYFHRERLSGMADWFKQQDPEMEKNGFLAGYVATKALVGELQEGWQQMLKSYDAQSDWGLTTCQAGYDDRGNCKAPEVRYPSYPQALRAFLIQTGYLQPEDKLPSP
ncbi:MAG: hypothetical protein LVS60_15815 [Nodosilinea sp. LVE1205-7]|jgi:hypothetical protein